MKTNPDDHVKYLTKREYFAAMALTGLAIQEHFQTYTSQQKAEKSVQYADNLINELNKEKINILDEKVYNIFLNQRACNCLVSANIIKIRDLVIKKESDLLKIKNFGKICLHDVKEELKLYNLSLGMKKDVL